MTTSETANHFYRPPTTRPRTTLPTQRTVLVRTPPRPTPKAVRSEAPQSRHNSFLKLVAVLGVLAAVGGGTHVKTEHVASENAAAEASASAVPFRTVKTPTYLDVSRLVFHRSGAPTLEETYGSYPTTRTVTLGYGDYTTSIHFHSTPEDKATSITSLSSELRLKDLSCYHGHLAVHATFGSPQLGPAAATIQLTKACTPSTDLAAVSSVSIEGQRYPLAVG